MVCASALRPYYAEATICVFICHYYNHYLHLSFTGDRPSQQHIFFFGQI